MLDFTICYYSYCLKMHTNSEQKFGDNIQYFSMLINIITTKPIKMCIILKSKLFNHTVFPKTSQNLQVFLFIYICLSLFAIVYINHYQSFFRKRGQYFLTNIFCSKIFFQNFSSEMSYLKFSSNETQLTFTC